LLVAEKHHAVFAESAADLGEHRVGQRLSQVDAGDLGVEHFGQRLYADLLVFHRILPNDELPLSSAVIINYRRGARNIGRGVVGNH
jgi:hypothetical protein